MKVIKKKQMADEGSTSQDDVRREIRIACSLDHPNIVKTAKGFETPEHFYIFMEPIVGGDLFDLVRKASYSNPQVSASSYSYDYYQYYENTSAFPTTVDLLSTLQSWMNEALCRRLFRQLLEAFKYLHAAGIMHGDMKPENVLLSEKPPSRVAQPVPETCQIKARKRPRARRAPAPSTRARRENTPRSPLCARALSLARADLRLRLRAPRRQELEEDAERDGREARVRHAQLLRA